MVENRRSYGSFFAFCVAAVFIVFSGVPKVESDGKLCVETPFGSVGITKPSIIDPVTISTPPVSVIDDPTVKIDPNGVTVDPNIDPIRVGIPEAYYNPVEPTVTYSSLSPDAGLGIRMSYPVPSGTADKMNILVSYDTQSSDAATFFTEQFTIEILQKFDECDVISWQLLPCIKTKVNSGVLSCPKPEQSEIDKIHSCAVTSCGLDQLKFASFVICFFTQGKQAQKCACENSLNYEEIQTCAQGEDGAIQCNVFYYTYHGVEFVADYSLYPPSSSTGLDGIDDFKNTVCTKLKEANLTCGVCCPPETG